MCAQSLSCIQLFVTPWTVACQAPLSMGFSRQEYWSELPFPSPGGSSQFRGWTRVSRIAGRFFTTEPPELTLIKAFSHSHFEPRNHLVKNKILYGAFFFLHVRKLKLRNGKQLAKQSWGPDLSLGPSQFSQSLSYRTWAYQAGLCVSFLGVQNWRT